jgi:Smg protein
MKGTHAPMFEILMYLFENYMKDNVVLSADLSDVVVELEKVGFYHEDIGLALDWLQGLIEIQELIQTGAAPTQRSIRCFSFEESERLGPEGMGFLLYLEQINILDPATREIVLDRLLALDVAQVDMGRIKWVVLITLFNQPSKKAALSLLQEMVLADTVRVKH